MKKGLIIVISGPAGSGKGTVVANLREMLPDIGFSVSATTRAPRPGEVHGKNYYYMSKDEFSSLLAKGEILEHTEYCDNFYGTLKSEALRVIEEGRDIILEIEVDGALQVKKLLPDDTVTVMLIAPNRTELENRLRGRGTETEEVIKRRLARATAEVAEALHYDYVVINETGMSDQCAKDIKNIIASEHHRSPRMSALIESYSNN